jgi:hypothetical protein
MWSGLKEPPLPPPPPQGAPWEPPFGAAVGIGVGAAAAAAGLFAAARRALLGRGGGGGGAAALGGGAAPPPAAAAPGAPRPAKFARVVDVLPGGGAARRPTLLASARRLFKSGSGLFVRANPLRSTGAAPPAH